MKNTILIALASILIGGAAGYVIGNTNEDAKSASNEASSKSSINRTRVEIGADTSSARKTPNYDEIMEMSSQTSRIQGLIDLYTGLDPLLFAEEAAKLDNLPMSDRILASYLLYSAWAEVDPTGALEHANGLGWAGAFVKPTILQSWAATDPVNAATYYSTNKRDFRMLGMMARRGDRDSQSPARTIASEWAKKDPTAALEWAQSLEGRDANNAITGVLSQIAKEDPSRATEMAVNLDEDSRGNAYQAIASEWANNDWDGAEKWINTLSGGERDRALSSAIRSLANNDASLAAEKFNSLPEGEERDQVTDNVAVALARDNPSQAMGWVIQNASDEARNESVRDVMSQWANQDSESAVTWINQQEGGEMRDNAVTSYLRTNQQEEPAKATALAATISNDRSRDISVGLSALRWMSDDQEAATQFLNTTDSVSDETRERVIKINESGGGVSEFFRARRRRN